MDKARIGDVVFSVLNGKPVTGAMAEFQQATGLASNEFSVRQLVDDTLEKRALTAAPSSVQANQNPIIPYVFPQSIAAFLGVAQPVVGVGETVFPVLTSALSVEELAESAEGTETDGTFTANLLTPKRLQASFRFSREDRARFAGMEESLRDNITMGLMDGLDKAIIAGANGLLTGTNLANHNVSSATTFANYKAQLAYARVDGRYAASVGDIRIVMGVRHLRPRRDRLPIIWRERRRRGRCAQSADGRHRGRQG